MKSLIAIAILLSLQGCATITDFGGRNSSIVATYEGETDSFANCTLKIKDWKKEVLSNSNVTIPHKRGLLEVSCEDETLGVKGRRIFESKIRKGVMIANVVSDFCTLSCLTDFATGSIYEFPNEIVIPMAAVK